MITPERFPLFTSHLPDLNRFILSLAEQYQAGEIKTWDDLEGRTFTFFNTEQMEALESVVPGWRKMASYLKGVTLTHIMCVFLGLLRLPEFQSLSQERQELAKWIVLFHDVQKEARRGERDPKHGFRSAVTTARQLSHLGFVVTEEYGNLIEVWSEFTHSAVRASKSHAEPIQDNEKLPEILAGIDRMFGESAPAGLIVKGVLLHMSINVIRDWQQAAPLTDEEIKKYVTSDLAPLLKVMMLADNDGWVLFYPEREQQRTETLETFQRIEKIISNGYAGSGV
jgi:hypothetical protein